MTDEAKKVVKALHGCSEYEYVCQSCCYLNYAESCSSTLMHDAADLIERMSDELEQLKRERDAAVRDLKLMDDLFREDPEMCCFCKYDHADYDEEPCNSCNPNPIENKWQWRGVCAELAEIQIKKREENSGGDADERN